MFAWKLPMSYNTFMKFFFSFLVSIIFFISLSLPAQAQLSGGTIDNTMEALLKNLSTELVSPNVKGIVNPGNPGSAEKTTIGEIDPDADGQGAVHSMSSTLALFVGTKPLSSNEYFANLLENIGVPTSSPAYAQYSGIGFDAFQPVLSIWKVFRNVAYLLYVLIFIIIGFMIMLRRKIDPQTVISIQTALPRLVVTLLLITFSYAIAGFIIDLMYVAIYIPAHLLSLPNGVFTNVDTVLNILLNNNVFDIIMPNVLPGGEQGPNMSEAPAQAIAQIIQSLVAYTLHDVVEWGAERVVKLIVGIMMLFSMFKLFLTLGVGFFRIILAVVLAPLQIMFNAIPGSDSFGKWLRGIVSDAAMFPAVAFIFMIAAALMGPVKYTTITGKEVDFNRWGVREEIGYQSGLGEDSGWIPPFLLLRGKPAGQTATSGAVNPAIALVGFFAIIITPQVATMTRDFLKVDQSKYGSAIGQSVGPAFGILSSPFRRMKAQGDARKQSDLQGRAIARHIGGPASNEGP